MSDVLERALASPWNPQRAREKVESMDRMRGSVVFDDGIIEVLKRNGAPIK